MLDNQALGLSLERKRYRFTFHLATVEGDSVLLGYSMMLKLNSIACSPALDMETQLDNPLPVRRGLLPVGGVRGAGVSRRSGN